MLKRIFFVMIALIIAPAICFADQEITLVWNPNSEYNLAGYRLYQTRDSGVYDHNLIRSEILVGSEITTITISDYDTYFWVVTAYNTDGLESGHSNEVTYTYVSNPPEIPTGLNIIF